VFQDPDPDWDVYSLSSEDPLDPVRKAIVLELDGNGIPDVALLCGGRVACIRDPAGRKQGFFLPPTGVTDAALHHLGGSGRDALFVAAGGTVEIWEWDDGVGGMLSRGTVSGPWSSPERLASTVMKGAAGDWNVLAVADASGLVHTSLAQRQGTEQVSVSVASWVVGPGTTALEILQLSGSLLPDVAVAQADQVQTYGLLGTLADVHPGPTTALVALAPDAQGAQKLAWVQPGVEPGESRVRILSGQGVEAPLELPWQVLGASFLEHGDEAWLLLEGSAGQATIWGVSDDPGGPTLSPADVSVFDPTPRQGRVPVLADFDRSGCGSHVDVLLCDVLSLQDDALLVAQLFRGTGAAHGASILASSPPRSSGETVSFELDLSAADPVASPLVRLRLMPVENGIFGDVFIDEIWPVEWRPQFTYPSPSTLVALEVTLGDIREGRYVADEAAFFWSESCSHFAPPTSTCPVPPECPGSGGAGGVIPVPGGRGPGG